MSTEVILKSIPSNQSCQSNNNLWFERQILKFLKSDILKKLSMKRFIFSEIKKERGSLTEYGSCIYRNLAKNDIIINTKEDFSEHPEHFRSFVASCFLHLICNVVIPKIFANKK